MVNFIKISDIDDSGRIRPVDRDHSELIAISMKEIGPKQPITIRPTPGASKPYRLVIGAHRLDAFRLNGWNDLEQGKHFVIEEMTEDQAKLAEIDENLARHELNALDRALFLLERKRIYQSIHPETARGGDRKSAKKSNRKHCDLIFAERFSRNAAKKVGLSERAIDLAIGFAEKLDPQAIKALRGTKLERNQRELLAIAELEPEQQRAVAGLIGAGAAKTSTQAKVTAGFAAAVVHDPQARLYSILLDAWTKADKVTRANFLEAADLAYAPAKGARK
ncbi:ParB/RepB/Spo0J family partition protein [Rhodoblastus sp.]|uniref:ParB/RepB/Spo0J family partition protein n=1 Tax=Rhodoblastus sp. TaxID=1962975 RepID=UPI002631B011|nr:ParB/RepB/Spo0J family partition protein [Rhodoblastus sp.]